MPTSYSGRVSKDSSADGAGARRPDRRPARTVRKVLDAGLAELRASSYADLTMRAVAHRAGVSPASAYNYFPSKSVLVASVYLDLLTNSAPQTTVDAGAPARVSAAMRDMALLTTPHPELTAAFGTALMADDPAVRPVAIQIATELQRRLDAALGPGYPPSVTTTLMMTFSGALVTSHFQTIDEVNAQLDQAVETILGQPVS